MNLHLAQLTQDYPGLASCTAQIEKTYEILSTCFRSGGKLLLAGNGGSAADCGHWAAELLKSFCKPRRLGLYNAQSFSTSLAEKLQGALPAIPLPSLTEFATAWANDRDPEYVYAQGVLALGRAGDTLAALSTSGNSANILRAVETARSKGMKIIGLSGESGGELAVLCDECICVPEREVYRVQQLHLPVYHCLCLMLEDEFFPES